jgi:hypothetical protein
VSALAEAGITFHHEKPGKQRMPCPECPGMSGNLAFIDFNAIQPLEPIEALKARVDIADIVGRYVALKQRGHEHRGLCPFHAENTPSFKADRRRQRYKCFGCGAGGDVIDFLMAVENLDIGSAIKRLRELAGSGAEPARVWSTVEADAEGEAKKAYALGVWAAAGPIVDALPLRYLREVRGLHGWRPDALRWHRSGCIVAPVTGPEGDLTAIWRIWPRLEGKVERKGLGPVKGGACRLFPGKGHRLLIAEGIEDALAGRMLTGLPAWAATSASNMAALVLPEQYREVLILADRDDNGVGLESARALASRLRSEGRKAVVRLPVAGKDANDVLRAPRAA